MSDSSNSIELSIVMPCLNEAQTLESCINKARKSLDDAQINGEIIIADNGSTDGSQQIATRLGARVVDVAAKGYGSALMGGITAARGKFVIMGDADDSYDFAGLVPFVEKLREGYELVMGNRFKGGIEKGAMPLLHRYFGNPFLSGVGRLFFKCPCKDFQCGLRGFSRQAILDLDLRTTGMEFASEMVVKSTLHKLRITEVPTTLVPDGRTRRPHLRSFRDGWRYLRFLLLYSPRWLFLIPGVILVLAGIIVGTWLLFTPIRVGAITFDVHTLLYAAMAVIIGFQAITFAIFTKVFAISEGLLPEDPRLYRLFKYITLETGLIAGGGLAVVGLVATLIAVGLWQRRGFGQIEEWRKTLRVAIPAVTCLVMGCQIIFASFFLSILGLRRK